MRKANLVLLALLAACLVTASLAFSQGAKSSEGDSVKQEVKALSDQAVQAYLKGNSSFFEKYYADDGLIIHSDGKLVSKAQELENFKSGNLKYDSIDVRETNIRVYGNVAVAEVMSSVKGTLGGKPVGGDFLSTRTWVKRYGNWKCVAYQATRVPAASQ
jgi:uncharacterized protein (TIGR02246 family)